MSDTNRKIPPFSVRLGTKSAPRRFSVPPCGKDDRHGDDTARNAEPDKQCALSVRRTPIIVAFKQIAHGVIEVASGHDRNRTGHKEDERGRMAQARADLGKSGGECRAEKRREEKRRTEIGGGIIDRVGK